MELLGKIYLGNTIQTWLVASGILIIVFIVLKTVHSLLISRLSSLADKTVTELDDLVVAMLKSTKFFTLLLISAYLASMVITLKTSTEAYLMKAVVIALILQAGFWASTGFSFWLERNIKLRMEQDSSSATTITFLGFVVRICLWVVILLMILGNLGVNITGLVAGLGVGGIAVALAVQNILGDLLASLSIVLDKPFVIGDFVVIDSYSGTIEHIGLKTTRIRSLNGEQLIFSNNDLLKSRVSNYRRMSERRVLFSFGVTYQTSLEKLKAIKEIVSAIINKEDYTRLDRVHFKEYGDFSLNFEVVYFVTQPDYNLYMDVQERINHEIFRQFGEEGIEFAILHRPSSCKGVPEPWVMLLILRRISVPCCCPAVPASSGSGLLWQSAWNCCFRIAICRLCPCHQSRTVISALSWMAWKQGHATGTCWMVCSADLIRHHAVSPMGCMGLQRWLIHAVINGRTAPGRGVHSMN